MALTPEMVQIPHFSNENMYGLQHFKALLDGLFSPHQIYEVEKPYVHISILPQHELFVNLLAPELRNDPHLVAK